MIAFNLVPSTARAKGVYIEPKNVLLSLGGLIAPRKIVCVGQYNDDKSPVNNAAKQIVAEGQEDDLYGKGSMLALSIKRARQGSNSLIPIYALPVPGDVSGVKATGSITIGGTASVAGSIPFYIAGTRFTLPVANGATGATLTSNLATAINAILDLPVSAAFSSPNCNVTAKNSGLVGNRIKIATRLEDSDPTIPTGLTVTITQLASGANDPDITNAINGLGNVFYTDIHCPYNATASLNILRDKYIERISPEFKKPFIGYVPNNQDLATYQATATALNSEAVSFIPTFESNTLDYLSSAWVCGFAALWYQSSPGRSFSGTVIPGVRVPSTLVNFNQGTQEGLVQAGATTVSITSDRQFAIRDLMTTKKTNSIGGPEIDLSRTERISNIQTKIYSLDTLLSSEPFVTGVVVDDDSTTSLAYAIRPKFVKGKIIQLVDELWIPLAISKNRNLIVQSIKAEINAGSGARIDVEIQDDLAVALDILAVAYRFGIRGGQS